MSKQDISKLAVDLAEEVFELEDSFEAGSKFAVGDDEIIEFANRLISSIEQTNANSELLAVVTEMVGRFDALRECLGCKEQSSLSVRALAAIAKARGQA